MCEYISQIPFLQIRMFLAGSNEDNGLTKLAALVRLVCKDILVCTSLSHSDCDSSQSTLVTGNRSQRLYKLRRCCNILIPMFVHVHNNHILFHD